MTVRARILLLLAVVAVAAGCGGSSVSLVPHGGSPSSRPTGSHTATPTPTPTPNGGPTMTVTAVQTALVNVQTIYQNLPHTSLASDLSTLAAQMVSSRAYRSAVVEPGGIAAKLPDGTRVLVFADRLEDVGGASPSARFRAPSAAARFDNPISGPNAHEIALLVNETDTSGAFTPARQFAFGKALAQSGFGSSTGYGVDEVDTSIADLVALGTGHPLDYFDIATHGMIGSDPDNPLATNTYYAWLSTTLPTSALISQYQADYNAGNLLNAMYLTLDKQTVPLSTIGFAFTPTFLTEHVHFNPGAIVDNESCFGQSPIIASNVQGVLQAAGVGRYLGWTKEVDGTDADETEGFLFDRLLGEQSPSKTGLDGFANQRTPPQRPFPLDDIETAMGAETRNSPIRPGPTNEPYTLSDVHIGINASAPPAADGTAARFIFTDFGGENVPDPVIEYRLPSIARLQVAESPGSGTLTIFGSFPAVSGNVQITDGSGVHPLPLNAWSATQISATLPAGGSGSAGGVQVFYGTAGSSEVIASNAVPLTQWQGKLVYTESDQTSPTASPFAFMGSGTIVATLSVNFRADVHPVVPQIDFSPEPQKLWFNAPEGDSSAAITTYQGVFTQNGGPGNVGILTYALASPAPTMAPTAPPFSGNQFDVAALGGQPAPCNDATPGPLPANAANVLCPGMGLTVRGTVVCSYTVSGVPQQCTLDQAYGTKINFGVPPSSGLAAGALEGGLLELTLDPLTSAMSVSSQPASFTPAVHFCCEVTATASVTGTFNTLYPPSSVTPALHGPRVP